MGNWKLETGDNSLGFYKFQARPGATGLNQPVKSIRRYVHGPAY